MYADYIKLEMVNDLADRHRLEPMNSRSILQRRVRERAERAGDYK